MTQKTIPWFVTIVFMTGCSGGTLPQNNSKINSEPNAAVVVPNEAAAAESNIAAASTTPKLQSTDIATAPGLQTTPSENSETLNFPATSPVPTPAPKPQVVVKPSAAQLAHWTRQAYEPLELLAFRHSSKVGFVACMAHTPDGKHFVLAGSRVTLWSITGSEPEHQFLDLADGSSDRTVKSLAISPNGEWIVAGDSEGTIRIWDLVDRKERISKKLGSTGITQIAISLDSKELATTSYSSEVTIWSAITLEQKSRLKTEPNLQQILYVAPNQLVAAGQKTILWNVGTSSPIQTLSEGGYNASLARSHDSKWLAFGDNDGLRLWNIAKSEMAPTFVGQVGTNSLVEFSPDSKLLSIATGFRISIVDTSDGNATQVIDTTGWTTVGLSWLPESNFLLIAKVDGSVRFWGTSKSAESFSMKAMHRVTPMPASSSKEPCWPSQLLQAIDLRSFERLPDSKPLVGSETMLTYESVATPADAMLFYRYALGERGWSELPANALTPGYLNFQKDGFKLFASISESAKGSNISLVSQGNFSLAWVPRFDGAAIEVLFENDNNLIYKTKAELLKIETNLLRKMHEAGWTAYSRLNSSHSEQVDSRRIEFIRNAIVLTVSIDKSPADSDTYMLNHSVMATIHSIPIPTDCGFVEFSSATQPLLVANTDMDLVKCREFFDREMLTQGWLPRTMGRIAKEEYEWLPYFRGQQDVTIGLSKHAEQSGTRIQVGTGFEQSSWQLSKPKEPTQPGKPAVGTEAADFPILNPSKTAKIELEQKSIELQMESTALPIVEKQYTEALNSQGWKLKDGGIRDDNYLFITFAKEGVEIALRARSANGNATVNFQGDGLLWTKPLPGSKLRISYESWSRQNRRLASLKWLADYEAAMLKIPAK